MHYKTNRLNHDFQIAYFLAGSCHTPDAAWSLLHDLREDRELALRTNEAQALRIQARVIRAQRLKESQDLADQCEGEADLLEIKALAEVDQKNIEAAKRELQTIVKCMEELEPLRKYKHLPDHEAHEAAQAEEWKLHLIFTAQNYMLTTGSVPPDHFATMRQHPDFQSAVLPRIDLFHKQIAEAGKDITKIPALLERPGYDIPAMLGYTKNEE
jgi:hypothetical protein